LGDGNAHIVVIGRTRQPDAQHFPRFGGEGGAGVRPTPINADDETHHTSPTLADNDQWTAMTNAQRPMND
jgi:hypothetical protein